MKCRKKTDYNASEHLSDAERLASSGPSRPLLRLEWLERRRVRSVIPEPKFQGGHLQSDLNSQITRGEFPEGKVLTVADLMNHLIVFSRTFRFDCSLHFSVFAEMDATASSSTDSAMARGVEHYLRNYILGRTLGIGSFGKVRIPQSLHHVSGAFFLGQSSRAS